MNPEKKPFSTKDLSDLISLAKLGIDGLMRLQKKLIKL